MTLIKIRLTEAIDNKVSSYEFSSIRQLKEFAQKKAGITKNSGSKSDKKFLENELSKKVQENK